MSNNKPNDILNQILSGSDANILYGTKDDDTLDGTNDDDILFGLAGNDSLFGYDGNDVLIGDYGFGSGDDWAFGSGSGSGKGSDKGSGSGSGSGSGKGSDKGSGSNNLTFDDYLDGGAGSDVLIGGAGNDTIIFDPATTGIIASDIICDFRDLGTIFATEDLLLSGGKGFDTLIGTTGNDFIDLNSSVFYGDNGGFEQFKLGAGNDVIIGERGSKIDEQFFIFGEAGTDVISFFGVKTTDIKLNIKDVEFDAASGSWTIDYKASGNRTVTLTQSQIQASGSEEGNWNPNDGLSSLFPGNPNFLDANYIDGGAGTNARLEGSEGSDIIFGGINTNDPDNDDDYDDFIYAGDGNDILVGGAGYDVYYVAKNAGDNFIFDGNMKENGYSNGLNIFAGFDDDGEPQGDLKAKDVTFTNNKDGTWTIDYKGGSTTFAGPEIDTVQLGSSSAPRYTYDDNGTLTNYNDDSYNQV